LSIEKNGTPISPILIVEEEFESVVMVLMDEAVEGETGTAFDINHHFFLEKTTVVWFAITYCKIDDNVFILFYTSTGKHRKLIFTVHYTKYSTERMYLLCEKNPLTD